MSKFNFFILIISCFLSSGLHSQVLESVKVTDLLKIKQISGLVMNREGTRALFTVTSIEPDGESKSDYKNINRICLAHLDGSGVIKQLTSSSLSSSQPAWSPDGKQFAFVRIAENKPQIFLLPIDGGEASQLTHYKYGATNPKWSPDGRYILFESGTSLSDVVGDSLLDPLHNLPSWPFEKPGIKKRITDPKTTPSADGSIDEIRAYLQKDEQDKKAIVVNKLNFQDETGVKSEWTLEEFYIIDVLKPTEPILISKKFALFNTVDFTPDGKHLIITGNIDSSKNPDRILESQILVSDIYGNGLHVLLGADGIVYNNPKISPSGKWMAYQRGEINSVNVPQLAILPFNEGRDNDLVHTFPIYIPFDRNKSNLTWSKDEQSIYFLAQTNGGVPLFKANIATEQVQQLGSTMEGILAFGMEGNKIIYTKTSIDDPGGLYMSDTTMATSSKLSTFNDWVRNKKISVPRKKSFINNKGMKVEYWIMKPIDFIAGHKYPLLLEMHGGPSVMWGPGEASMWHEFQYFCGKGYGIVYCNPRGSSGYGTDFVRGNIKDWGDGPASDVLTALDNAVNEGWADTSKLMITGGSYAGYLTAWIIAHDHRFKAACSQRGVYDLATFFGEGNAWRLVPEYFGGYPWEPGVKELLVRESPISYVQNITTPYIIFHGDNDRRTGFVQGEMMFRSLKVLGRPVEYVRHPGATHEITRSGDNRQRIDQMLRTYEFFERYLLP